MNNDLFEQMREDIDLLTDQVAQVTAENARVMNLLVETQRVQRSETSDDEGNNEPTETPEELTSWAERASAQEWDELIGWADWLLETYQVQMSYLYACWPAHPGIVEDLAALKMAWEAAVAKSAESEWHMNEALAYWHERYLAGFFARLHPVHSAGVCKAKHEEPRRAVITDRSMAVVVATGEPLEDALREPEGVTA